MEWLWIIIAVVVVAAILIFVVRKKKTQKGGSQSPVYSVDVYHAQNKRGTTGAGTACFKIGGLSSESMNLAAAGLARAMDAGARLGYQYGLNPADYQIGFFPAASECGTPAFQILRRSTPVVVDSTQPPPPTYDQSEYDLDPTKNQIRICVAGKMSITHKSGDPNQYTLDINDESLKAAYFYRLSVVDDPSMTEVAAYNEAEHVLAMLNDKELWARTAGPGHSHPLLPQSGIARGFRMSGFSCGVDMEYAAAQQKLMKDRQTIIDNRT